MCGVRVAALVAMWPPAGAYPIAPSPTAAHVPVPAPPAQAVRGWALNDSMEAQPTHSTTAGTMLRTATNRWVRIRLTPLRALASPLERVDRLGRDTSNPNSD